MSREARALPADAMTTDEMLDKFEVNGFMYWVVDVTRKSDGVRGTLVFDDDLEKGRRYHTFVPA